VFGLDIEEFEPEGQFEWVWIWEWCGAGRFDPGDKQGNVLCCELLLRISHNDCECCIERDTEFGMALSTATVARGYLADDRVGGAVVGIDVAADGEYL
jgi:hypothetical protein